MTLRIAKLAALALVPALAAAPLAAQGAGARMDSTEFANWRGLARHDIGQLREKIMGLARAVPADKLGWRPMEGVRSFHDVFAHIAAEGNIEPVSFGRPLLPGSVAKFDAEEDRLRALPDAELIPAMDRALENMANTIAGIEFSDVYKPMRFFGANTYPRGAVALGLYDLHEHLGQLVAYARMNRIVPPWSK
ncbi:MAG: DinB family protein [Gemmatimonadales bacterium]